MKKKVKAAVTIEDEVKVVIQYKDGRTEIRTNECKHSVTDVGLDWIVQRWDSNTIRRMLYGAVGEGTNTPAAGDTELQTELLRKTFSVSTNPSTGKKHWEFLVDWSECNGKTLSEVGVLDDPEVGNLLLRELLSPTVDKTSDKKVTIIIEVTVSRA